MFIYFGTTYTSVSAGKVLKRVCCERCGTVYYYQMARTGRGRSHAAYRLTSDYSAAQSLDAAEEHLRQRLKSETELVPCPECHWVNNRLIRGFRTQCWTRLVTYTAVPLVIVGFGLLLLVPAVKLPSLQLICFVLFGLCLFSPIWLGLIRHRLRMRMNPNLSHPNPPVVPPGTPMPLVKRIDPQSQQVILLPMPYRSEQLRQEPGWVLMHEHHENWSRKCCVCMKNATTTYQPCFTVNKNSELPAPLCLTCSSAYNVRWWLAAAVTAVVVVAMSAGLALSIGGVDTFGRWLTFGTVAFFATSVALAIVPAHMTRPYRAHIINKSRGVLKFRAANPEYTRLLQTIVEQEASYISPELASTAGCDGFVLVD